jgi:tetratricopeptide (TPR) repeat protein
LLTIGTLAVFSSVRHHDFINYDDNLYVTENEHVLAGLTWQGVIWAFTATHAWNWHPLTWLSHMLDCELFGVGAGGHHLTNLLLHAANSVLLFLVLFMMTRALWRSAVVAALFALHPLHVESVAWVSERKDVLSTLFWISAMGAYTWYARAPGWRRYLVVCCLVALGLMAKPMLVTLPLVFLLLDYWPLGRLHFDQRSSVSSLVWEKIPLFVLSALSAVVTFLVQQQEGAIQSLELVPLKVRVANALVAYAGYLRKMIWPKDLAVFYPHPGSVPFWKPAVACFFLLAVCVLVKHKGRLHPYLVTGWLWYLGTLVPVIGIVQVGAHSMADRYAYVPLIGLFIMLVWGTHDLTREWLYRKIILVPLVTAYILALAAGTWQHLGHWKNSISLFEHAVRVTSNNYIAHLNLGTAWYSKGEVDVAISHFSKALRINANHANIHDSLGVALLAKGRFKEAIPHFSRALEIDPDAEGAKGNLKIALRHMDEPDDEAEGHNRKAIALAAEGKVDAAIALFKEAIRMKPDFFEGHYNLGNAFARQEELDEAIHHYEEAIRISPHYAEARNNLGIALAKQGKLDEAIEHFSGALQIRPDFSEARKNLQRAEESR